MAQKYFSGLNYTLGNEDTCLEIELVKRLKSKSIFSVCGSGGRSLPLSGEATDLTLTDLSIEQLRLAKLREATYKQLSHSDFLLFWGYFPYADNESQLARKKLFLNLELESEVQSYFQNIFEETKFSSLLYLGKWERTFGTLAKINRFLLGSDFDRILRFDDLNAQKKYYQNEFPLKRWKAVIFLLGNKALFNALLYKGEFIEKNSPDSHFDFYYKAFERLFTNGVAAESFFLHLCFYGKINSLTGVPVEASLESHQRIASSKTKVNYLNIDMITHLKSGVATYDFLSLSDVPSYFKGDLEKNFMQMIRPGLKPGAIIVNRNYLRVPDCNLADFVDITSFYKDIISSEKVQMYDIRIYRYDPKN
jgi:S-adenosylmethionine-diacylglycerol 3-amino-3-carboxypropyl transferase